MLREQHLIQFPSVLGAVVPYVNLPGVEPNRLRLTDDVLADIFLGKVTRWNDARIGAENAGLRLPALPVSLKNRAGGFVAPDAAAFARAAEAGDWSAPGFAVEMIDMDAAGAWPIVSPTFVLMPSNPAADKVEGSRNTMRFFDWAFRNAGDATRELGFVPLPDSLHAPIKEVWRRVKGPDGQPIWEA